jgi:L-fuconolactonase
LRIVDAHQHFWHGKVFEILKLPPEMELLRRNYTPEDLKPLIDEAGVQQTVLVQTYSSLENTRDFLHLAESLPWVGAVVGWVDLTAPDLDESLAELQRHPKFKGVRHQWHDEPDPGWIVRPEVLHGLSLLAARRTPYELLVKEPNWPYMSRVADMLPDLPLVIDHIGKPRIRSGQFDDWAAAMAEAASFPQVMCKLSGMVTEADWRNWKPSDLRPYVDKVVELFGVKRVMFGSDWPVCLLAGSYAQVFSAIRECLSSLSEDELELVMGENARRFYGLQ